MFPLCSPLFPYFSFSSFLTAPIAPMALEYAVVLLDLMHSFGRDFLRDDMGTWTGCMLARRQDIERV